MLIAVASRNSRGAVAAFAWGRGISSLGSLRLARRWAYTRTHWPAWARPCSTCSRRLLILLFVGYALIGLKQLQLSRGHQRRDARGNGCGGSAEGHVRRTLPPRWPSEYGLTPRELEVFQMLARGRDRAYIQEQLVVSRNTVKAHVKHIYAKFDIHSHQDLIDLVEKG